MDILSFVRQTYSYLSPRLPQYIEELRYLCAIDSGTEYKPGIDEIASYLATRMHNIGMTSTIFEHATVGNDIAGVLRGSGTGIVTMLGHMDTVYPVGTASINPLRIEDTLLYAPGACDMKGGLLLALYAIEALLAADYHQFGEIRFLCVSDEETSQRHSVDLIHQICDGSQAVFVLEAARANGAIVSARKGTAWYTLTARGRAAHAGVEPEKGYNAIIELSHQILQFQQLHQWCEGLTINVGVISGGTIPNIVPAFAQARLDLRFLRAQDRLATEQRWQKLLQHFFIPGVEVDLELEAYRDPMECTAQTLQLVQQAQMLAKMSGFALEHVLTGGTSDGRYAAEVGIPVLDGLGPIGGRDHSPDEYLDITSVTPRATLLAGLIVTLMSCME